jgi:hypothetical protein
MNKRSHNMKKIKIAAVYVVLVLAFCTGSLFAADLPETFSCMAFSTSAAQSRSRIKMTINIDEYTSNEEIINYMNILKEGSQDDIKAEIEKVNKGWTHPRGDVREAFNFARSYNLKKGRLIVIVKSRDYRKKDFGTSKKRSKEFRFIYILLQLDEKGKGTGSMFPATSFQIDEKGRIVLPAKDADAVNLERIEPKK